MYLWIERYFLTATAQLFLNHAILLLELSPGIHLADCAVGEYTDVGDVTLSVVVDGICTNGVHKILRYMSLWETCMYTVRVRYSYIMASGVHL